MSTFCSFVIIYGDEKQMRVHQWCLGSGGGDERGRESDAADAERMCGRGKNVWAWKKCVDVQTMSGR